MAVLHVVHSIGMVHFHPTMHWKETMLIHTMNFVNFLSLILLLVFGEWQDPVLLLYCVGDSLLIAMHLLFVPELVSFASRFCTATQSSEKKFVAPPVRERHEEMVAVKMRGTAPTFRYAYGHTTHNVGITMHDIVEGVNIMPPEGSRRVNFNPQSGTLSVGVQLPHLVLAESARVDHLQEAWNRSAALGIPNSDMYGNQKFVSRECVRSSTMQDAVMVPTHYHLNVANNNITHSQPPDMVVLNAPAASSHDYGTAHRNRILRQALLDDCGL